MEQKLDDLRSERLRVMDEVCELLSDIPPSRITQLHCNPTQQGEIKTGDSLHKAHVVWPLF